MAGKAGAGGSVLDKLSLPGKLAVGFVLMLMFAAAYFVVFYGDVEAGIAAQRQTLISKRTDLQKAEDAKKAYNQDLAEKARREQLARKQKKILPDESESPAFLSAVQTVATISGVKLTSWTPLDEVPAEFYAKVPMQLKVEGRYHQIAKFFHGIGQIDRIINMENIVIKAAPKAKNKRPSEEEETADSRNVEVHVECLATAFRALRATEGGGKKKKGRRRGAAGK